MGLRRVHPTRDINVLTSWMGVDPGASGAAIVLTRSSPGGEIEIDQLLFKGRTLQEIWRFFREQGIYLRIRKCYLEKVHAMPKQGVTSTFSFGENYGSLQMAILAADIPFERVLSSSWQREFSLPSLKECDGNNTRKKNAHKARAQELFPDVHVTHANADALLIAEYCRRKES